MEIMHRNGSLNYVTVNVWVLGSLSLTAKHLKESKRRVNFTSFSPKGPDSG
jgi:hypothetical protein